MIPKKNKIRELLTPFLESLKDAEGVSEQEFFVGREALKQVFDKLSAPDKQPMAQAFWSVQALLGSLIRKGQVDQLTALTSISGLLESLLVWSEVAPASKVSFSLAPPVGEGSPNAQHYLKLANGPLVEDSGAGEEPLGELSGLPTSPAPEPFRPTNEHSLGQLLLQSGKLGEPDLKRALSLQKINGRRLGDVLIAMEAVGIQTLEEALTRQKFLTSCKSSLPADSTRSNLGMG